MATNGVVREMKEERKRQKQAALNKLKEFFRNKISLKRPVFFVPGWTDESCANWAQPYKSFLSIREWIERICNNRELVNFIKFSEKETIGANSFVDLGLLLKNKIESVIGPRNEFDLIGHSMGGLDIRAAIELHGLKNVVNCITVATPHKGTEFGDIGPRIMKYKPHHKIQCINMDPDHLPIQTINSSGNRKKFLRGVRNFCQFVGTRDMVVARNAKIDTEGLDTSLCNKVTTVEIGGVTHSAKDGITRDVRTIVALVNILIGIQPEKPKYNYGYILRKA